MAGPGGDPLSVGPIRPDEIIESGDVVLRPEGEVRVTRSEARLRLTFDTSPLLPPRPFLRPALDGTAYEAAARALWDALTEADAALTEVDERAD